VGKTDIKWCSECNEEKLVEWLNLSEQGEIPEFAYTCLSCGTIHDAEPPIHFKSRELPKEQTTL